MHGSAQLGSHIRPAQAAVASHQDYAAIQELHWQYVTLQRRLCRAPEIPEHDEAGCELMPMIGCLGDLSDGTSETDQRFKSERRCCCVFCGAIQSFGTFGFSDLHSRTDPALVGCFDLADISFRLNHAANDPQISVRPHRWHTSYVGSALPP